MKYTQHISVFVFSAMLTFAQAVSPAAAQASEGASSPSLPGVVFTAEEIPLAVSLIVSGQNVTQVAFSEQLWGLVRAQREVVELASGHEYFATDAAIRLARLDAGSKEFIGTFANGQSFLFRADLMLEQRQLLLAAASIGTSPDDAIHQTSSSSGIFSLYFVAGSVFSGGGEVHLTGVLVDGMSRDGTRSYGLVIRSRVEISAEARASLAQAQLLFESPRLSETGTNGDPALPPPDAPEPWLVCFGCWACAGVTGGICGGFCFTQPYWDTPGEGTASCIVKCLEAAPGAAPGTAVSCAVACFACSGKGLLKDISPTKPGIQQTIRPGLLEYIR